MEGYVSEIQRPDGITLEEWMGGRVARYENKKFDWDALKFQTQVDPKYARAQMRYVGTGATGVAIDPDTIPAEHFTFTTMLLPAGHEFPSHLHVDVEETFFMIRGQAKFIVESEDEKVEVDLKELDLVSVPPGTYRAVVNTGQVEALMAVVIGAKKPVTPTYPESHPLSKIKR